MNIFNGRKNYGPIIDVVELPSTEINKHAIYRLIDPEFKWGTAPCGLYKTRVSNYYAAEDGIREKSTGALRYDIDSVISKVLAGSSDFPAATYDDEFNKVFTIVEDKDFNYRYIAGPRTPIELIALGNAKVIDHYVYDIDHWVSIGTAIAYVDTLPEVTDPMAATKVFVHEVGIGGGAYELEGIYILDKENGEWIELMKGRVIMMTKEDYDDITPKNETLYVVI